MKYLKYFVLLLLLIPLNVHAANICNASRHNALKVKAHKVDLSYELKFDEAHNPYFEITVMNMTDELLLKFDGTTYKATETGMFVIDDKLEGGNTYKFNFYGGYGNVCVEQFIYSKSLKLPKYNIYSEREECIEYEDFPLCNKWYSKEIGSDNDFLLALETYKDSLEENKPIDLDSDNRTIFERIIDFYLDYLIVTLPLTILVIAGITFLIVKKIIKNRKRVKLNNENFKL